MLYFSAFVIGGLLLLNAYQTWVGWKERNRYMNELAQLVVAVSQNSKEYLTIKTAVDKDNNIDPKMEYKPNLKRKENKQPRDLIL